LGTITLGRLKQLIREQLALAGQIAQPIGDEWPWELNWETLLTDPETGRRHQRLDIPGQGPSVTMETDPKIIDGWIEQWTSEPGMEQDRNYNRGVEALLNYFPKDSQGNPRPELKGLDWGHKAAERENARLQARFHRSDRGEAGPPYVLERTGASANERFFGGWEDSAGPESLVIWASLENAVEFDSLEQAGDERDEVDRVEHILPRVKARSFFDT